MYRIKSILLQRKFIFLIRKIRHFINKIKSSSVTFPKTTTKPSATSKNSTKQASKHVKRPNPSRERRGPDPADDNDQVGWRPQQEMWERLPELILIQVFAQLSAADRASAAQVCRHWGRCLAAPCLWRKCVVHIDRDLSLDYSVVSELAVSFPLRFPLLRLCQLLRIPDQVWRAYAVPGAGLVSAVHAAQGAPRPGRGRGRLPHRGPSQGGPAERASAYRLDIQQQMGQLPQALLLPSELGSVSIVQFSKKRAIVDCCNRAGVSRTWSSLAC